MFQWSDNDAYLTWLFDFIFILSLIFIWHFKLLIFMTHRKCETNWDKKCNFWYLYGIECSFNNTWTVNACLCFVKCLKQPVNIFLICIPFPSKLFTSKMILFFCLSAPFNIHEYFAWGKSIICPDKLLPLPYYHLLLKVFNWLKLFFFCPDTFTGLWTYLNTKLFLLLLLKWTFTGHHYRTGQQIKNDFHFFR